MESLFFKKKKKKPYGPNPAATVSLRHSYDNYTDLVWKLGALLRF